MKTSTIENSNEAVLDDATLEDISGGRRRRGRRGNRTVNTSGVCESRPVGTWRIETTPAVCIPGTWVYQPC